MTQLPPRDLLACRVSRADEVERIAERLRPREGSALGGMRYAWSRARFLDLARRERVEPVVALPGTNVVEQIG